MSALRQEITENRKLDTILWVVGVAFAAFLAVGVYQLISFGEVKAQTVSNTADIEKIRGDYLPLFAFEYIVESNNELINLISIIQQTTKDDPRYLDAIKKWNDLQQEVIRQAGQNKRSGSGGTSAIGGE